MKNTEHGFTLVEVLVVAAIIGMLAALAIPQYAMLKSSAADADAKADLHNIATAMESYFNQTATYVGASFPVLASMGYRPTSTVSATIGDTDENHYVIMASGMSGTGTFTLDSRAGSISGPS